MFLNSNLERAGAALAMGCLHFLLLSLAMSPLQEAVNSFACKCPTEPIKSSLFYRRRLIELARLPSLGSFSILKIT